MMRKATHRIINVAAVAVERVDAVAVACRDTSNDADVATKKDIALAVAEIKGELGTMRWMLGVMLALAVANFTKQHF